MEQPMMLGTIESHYAVRSNTHNKCW